MNRLLVNYMSVLGPNYILKDNTVIGADGAQIRPSFVGIGGLDT